MCRFIDVILESVFNFYILVIHQEILLKKIKTLLSFLICRASTVYLRATYQKMKSY